MSSNHPQQPPAPYSDFQYSFDHSAVFPDAPPASSAELFSENETSDLFGFLDNFSWEFDADALNNSFAGNSEALDTGYYGLADDSMAVNGLGIETNVSSQSTDHISRQNGAARAQQLFPNDVSDTSSTMIQSNISPPPPSNHMSSSLSTTSTSTDSTSVPPRAKPLLTDPQKRMNHIMSEQKRRNAIREGYAQLTSLIAPAGAPPGTGMPTRGRPKGSGARGKGRPGAGKSGVLLRAVEYVKWLEEGRDALLEEVERLEAVAGIRAQCMCLYLIISF